MSSCFVVSFELLEFALQLCFESSVDFRKVSKEAIDWVYIPKITILRTRKYNFLRREIQCVSVLSVEEVAVLKHNGLVRFPENSRD